MRVIAHIAPPEPPPTKPKRKSKFDIPNAAAWLHEAHRKNREEMEQDDIEVPGTPPGMYAVPTPRNSKGVVIDRVYIAATPEAKANVANAYKWLNYYVNDAISKYNTNQKLPFRCDADAFYEGTLALLTHGADPDVDKFWKKFQLGAVDSFGFVQANEERIKVYVLEKLRPYYERYQSTYIMRCFLFKDFPYNQSATERHRQRVYFGRDFMLRKSYDPLQYDPVTASCPDEKVADTVIERRMRESVNPELERTPVWDDTIHPFQPVSLPEELKLRKYHGLNPGQQLPELKPITCSPLSGYYGAEDYIAPPDPGPYRYVRKLARDGSGSVLKDMNQNNVNPIGFNGQLPGQTGQMAMPFAANNNAANTAAFQQGVPMQTQNTQFMQGGMQPNMMPNMMAPMQMQQPMQSMNDSSQMGMQQQQMMFQQPSAFQQMMPQQNMQTMQQPAQTQMQQQSSFPTTQPQTQMDMQQQQQMMYQQQAYQQQLMQQQQQQLQASGYELVQAPNGQCYYARRQDADQQRIGAVLNLATQSSLAAQQAAVNTPVVSTPKPIELPVVEKKPLPPRTPTDLPTHELVEWFKVNVDEFYVVNGMPLKASQKNNGEYYTKGRVFRGLVEVSRDNTTRELREQYVEHWKDATLIEVNGQPVDNTTPKFTAPEVKVQEPVAPTQVPASEPAPAVQEVAPVAAPEPVISAPEAAAFEDASRQLDEIEEVEEVPAYTDLTAEEIAMVANVFANNRKLGKEPTLEDNSIAYGTGKTRVSWIDMEDTNRLGPVPHAHGESCYKDPVDIVEFTEALDCRPVPGMPSCYRLLTKPYRGMFTFAAPSSADEVYLTIVGSEVTDTSPCEFPLNRAGMLRTHTKANPIYAWGIGTVPYVANFSVLSEFDIDTIQDVNGEAIFDTLRNLANALVMASVNMMGEEGSSMITEDEYNVYITHGFSSRVGQRMIQYLNRCLLGMVHGYGFIEWLARTFQDDTYDDLLRQFGVKRIREMLKDAQPAEEVAAPTEPAPTPVNSKLAALLASQQQALNQGDTTQAPVAPVLNPTPAPSVNVNMPHVDPYAYNPEVASADVARFKTEVAGYEDDGRPYLDILDEMSAMGMDIDPYLNLPITSETHYKHRRAEALEALIYYKTARVGMKASQLYTGPRLDLTTSAVMPADFIERMNTATAKGETWHAPTPPQGRSWWVDPADNCATDNPPIYAPAWAYSGAHIYGMANIALKQLHMYEEEDTKMHEAWSRGEAWLPPAPLSTTILYDANDHKFEHKTSVRPYPVKHVEAIFAGEVHREPVKVDKKVPIVTSDGKGLTGYTQPYLQARVVPDVPLKETPLIKGINQIRQEAGVPTIPVQQPAAPVVEPAYVSPAAPAMQPIEAIHRDPVVISTESVRKQAEFLQALADGKPLPEGSPSSVGLGSDNKFFQMPEEVKEPEPEVVTETTPLDEPVLEEPTYTEKVIEVADEPIEEVKEEVKPRRAPTCLAECTPEELREAIFSDNPFPESPVAVEEESHEEPEEEVITVPVTVISNQVPFNPKAKYSLEELGELQHDYNTVDADADSEKQPGVNDTCPEFPSIFRMLPANCEKGLPVAHQPVEYHNSDLRMAAKDLRWKLEAPFEDFTKLITDDEGGAWVDCDLDTFCTVEEGYRAPYKRNISALVTHTRVKEHVGSTKEAILSAMDSLPETFMGDIDSPKFANVVSFDEIHVFRGSNAALRELIEGVHGVLYNTTMEEVDLTPNAVSRAITYIQDNVVDEDVTNAVSDILVSRFNAAARVALARLVTDEADKEQVYIYYNAKSLEDIKKMCKVSFNVMPDGSDIWVGRSSRDFAAAIGDCLVYTFGSIWYRGCFSAPERRVKPGDAGFKPYLDHTRFEEDLMFILNNSDAPIRIGARGRIGGRTIAMNYANGKFNGLSKEQKAELMEKLDNTCALRVERHVLVHNFETLPEPDANSTNNVIVDQYADVQFCMMANSHFTVVETAYIGNPAQVVNPCIMGIDLNRNVVINRR